jgi:DNA mismatch endonuclease (patch repair protein)
VADIVIPAVRSRMMAGIRGKDTKPELFIRRLLHRMGFRFRIHPTHLAGRPDLVLPMHRVAIFVHGCFWHQHAGCRYATVPASNKDFWAQKLGRNRGRDAEVQVMLIEAGWRVLTIWECRIRESEHDDDLAEKLCRWIRSARKTGEFPRPKSLRKSGARQA